MALLLKNGAVFLHVPKTGGNWITSVLFDLDLVEKRVSHKHADVDHFFASVEPQGFASVEPKGQKSSLKRTMERLLPSRKSRPFVFCFVRNPLVWYESWFKYMTQPRRQWMDWGDEHDPYNWHPNAMLNGLGDRDFNQFVRNVIRKRPGYVTELYGWYARPDTNFVGKQENLADDFVRVLDIMNVKFDEDYVRNYERVGVSPDIGREITWEDSLKKEVAIMEYAGMIRYGYQSKIITNG